MNVYKFAHRSAEGFDAPVTAEDESHAWSELEDHLNKIAAEHNIDIDMGELYIRSAYPYVDD